MIGTIKRLWESDRRRVSYEEAAGEYFFSNDAAGIQQLEDLANNRVEPKKIDESYFSWLAGVLADLSDQEWNQVKNKREA